MRVSTRPVSETHLDLGPEAEAFRDEVREWLAANKPDDLVGVDAERAARHHRNVARCQSRRDVRRGMLAVGRRRARADDGRGPAGHVVQPGRADRPQH